MCKKIILSIISVIVVIMGGFKVNEVENQTEKIQKNEVVGEYKDEALTENEIINQEEIVNETIETVESVDEQQNQSVTESTTKNQNKQIETNETKDSNQTKRLETKPTEQQNNNTQVTSNQTEKNTNEKDTSSQTQETTKKEQTETIPKTEEIKETTTYNDAESKKMLADIDNLAKQNKDLWKSNGEKLYSVEINEGAMKSGEYLYPYSIDRLKGKVLNVFSVKFLVYAVDVQKTGFAKETHHYIKLVEF